MRPSKVYSLMLALLATTNIFAQSAATGKIGLHEYVDLGLSVLWATCNVGANSPEGYGGFYAWGETSTKSSYDEDNCETYGKDIGDIGGTSRDVARVKWGSPWRMPTEDECNELIYNCDWTLTSLNGKKGYKVVSKKNGNSIFLPFAGVQIESSIQSVGEYGVIWSSTPHDVGPYLSIYLSFFRETFPNSTYRDNYDIDETYRYKGYSVRPVADKVATSRTSHRTYVFTGEVVCTQPAGHSQLMVIDGTKNVGCLVSYISGSYNATGTYTNANGVIKTLFDMKVTEVINGKDGNSVSFTGEFQASDGTVYASLLYKSSDESLMYSDSRGNLVLMYGVKLK